MYITFNEKGDVIHKKLMKSKLRSNIIEWLQNEVLSIYKNVKVVHVNSNKEFLTSFIERLETLDIIINR